MTKTKGFLLAVAVAAMAFTFSCSDDSSDGDGNSSSSGGGNPSSSSGGVEFACYAASSPLGDNTPMCLELNVLPASMKDIPRDQLCATIGAKDGVSMAVRESCPSGQTLKCPRQSDDKGTSATVYLYGTLPAGFTCASMDDD